MRRSVVDYSNFVVHLKLQACHIANYWITGLFFMNSQKRKDHLLCNRALILLYWLCFRPGFLYEPCDDDHDRPQDTMVSSLIWPETRMTNPIISYFGVLVIHGPLLAVACVVNKPYLLIVLSRHREFLCACHVQSKSYNLSFTSLSSDPSSAC